MGDTCNMRVLLFVLFLFTRTCYCLKNNCPLGTPNRDDGLCDVEPEDEEYYLSSIHPMSARAQMSKDNLYYHHTYHESEYTLHRVRRGTVVADQGSGSVDSLSGSTAPLLTLSDELELQKVQQSYSIADTEWSPAISVGIQAFCRSFKRIYISSKGYISFDRKHRANPTTFPLTKQANDPDAEDILAAFLGFTKGWSNAWIYFYHLRSTDQSAAVQAIITEVKNEVNDFEGITGWEPTDVIIVKWNGTVPDYCKHIQSQSCHGWQSNIFEAAIITDGSRTYVMYNYKSGGIKGSYLGKDIRFGYQLRDKKFQVGYISGTVSMQKIDKLPGNTRSSKPGRWIFRLFNAQANGQPTSCNQYEYKCLNWLSNTVSSAYWIQWRLPPCPCNGFQAALDQSFVKVSSVYPNQNCYGSRWFLYYQSFFPLARQYFIQQRCCYRAVWISKRLSYPWGPLITADTKSEAPGTMQFLSIPKTASIDVTGHDYCCVKSRRFCHRFYHARPADSCKWYRPPRFSSAWGDPHIVTLDGLSYTFNGLGYYWLVKTLNRQSNSEPLFNMQTQTAKVFKNDGSPGNATAYHRLVARDNNSDIVEIKVVKPDDMEMYLNKQRHNAFDTTTFPNDLQLDKNNHITFVTRESRSVTVVNFPSGWTMKITASQGFLSIEVSSSQLNTTSITTGGLLGVMDNDQSNDLTALDGTILSISSTDSEIYNNFGQTWGVLNGADSMFHDDASGIDDTFVPEFNPCQTYNLTEEAKTICLNDTNSQCMFDYCITRNGELANETLQKQQTFSADQVVRLNTIPRVVTVSSVNVQVGQETVFQVNGTDDDGDDVTLALAGTVPEASFVSGEFRWTPLDATPVLVGFIATDNSGASSPITEVIVILCDNCTDANHGTCDFNDKWGDSTVTSFYRAACDCKPGYEGLSCQNDINGCLGDPCANCTDLTPAEEAASNFTRGYRCDCNVGYKLVQDICINIDECDQSNNTICDQICVDNDGSYTCQCSDGYRLQPDGRNCTNIDECTEQTHNCTQLCNDNEGGFTCDCHGGWTLQADGVSCSPPQTCSLACQHICTLTANVTSCQCNPGFELQSDDLNCIDINECQQNLHTCSHNCKNIDAGYTCECPIGFTLLSDQRTCTECDDQHWGENCAQPCNCSANVLECNKTHGCINCITGFRGYDCQENINECKETPNLCTGINEECVDTIGSYVCQCQSGYERNNTGYCELIPSTTAPVTTTAEPITTQTSGTYTSTTQSTAATQTAAAASTSQTAVTTAAPVNKNTLEIKTDMDYQKIYSNQNNLATIKLAADWKKTLDSIYGNLPQFISLSDISFTSSFDKLVVQYQLNLADESPANTSHALGYLQDYLTKAKSDILNVGSQQAKVQGITAKLNGTQVEISNSCSIMNSQGLCINGRCQVQADINQPPQCVCSEGYEGQFCASPSSQTSTQRVPVEVIVASCLAALLFIASCIGAVFIYRRRRTKPSPKSRSLTDWEDYSGSSSSGRSNSDRTERSVWLSPYTKSNMYRAYGLPHGYNAGYPGNYRQFEPYY